jgi:hypothetical protein
LSQTSGLAAGPQLAAVAKSARAKEVNQISDAGAAALSEALKINATLTTLG